MKRIRPVLGPLLAAGGLVVLIVLAAVFATRDLATRVADDALFVGRLDEVLLASNSARSAIATEFVVVTAESEGLLGPIDAQETHAQVRSLLDLTENRAASLAEAATDLSMLYAAVSTSRQALEAVDDREYQAARDLIEQALGEYAESDARLLAVRGEALGRILAAGSSNRRAAQAASFGVAFIVPLLLVLGLRSSISHRRRTDRLRVQVEQEREMRIAKDEMIGNLSHELRTPLTGIYGFAMAIDENSEDPAFMKEMNALIIEQAAELTRMVDDLLTAARADSSGLSYHIETVTVRDEIEAVVEPMRVQGSDVRVRVPVETTVQADRLRLRQVLRNLISNGLRHGEPPVRVDTRSEGGHLVISIADDGDGVPDDIRQRMFDRFVHDGSQPLLTGSVGLGLSIARLLTEAMSGTLTYRREDDRTVFEIRLPVGGTALPLTADVFDLEHA